MTISTVFQRLLKESVSKRKNLYNEATKLPANATPEIHIQESLGQQEYIC